MKYNINKPYPKIENIQEYILLGQLILCLQEYKS